MLLFAFVPFSLYNLLKSKWVINFVKDFNYVEKNCVLFRVDCAQCCRWSAISEQDWFVFTLLNNVVRKAFKELWIFTFVDGTQNGRGCPAARIH